MDADREFRQAIANADALGREGRWEDAGALYARAATFAMEHQQLDVAREVWGVAGEAFRRADLPSEADRALRLSLAIPGGDVESVAVRRVRYSAVLADLGEFEAAYAQCEEAAGAPGAQAMARDGAFSVGLAIHGRGLLDRSVEGLSDPRSRALRQAQLDRMHGRLAAADAGLAALERELTEPVGLGGIRAERAEIAGFQGRTAWAIEAWEQAVDDHRRAGRISLAWRAEAGRARALMDAGIAPLEAPLAEGLAWAEARGMRPLAVDLRIPLGQLRRDARTLERAEQDARSMGMIRRSGRAMFARASLLAGPARLALVQEAADRLMDDAPWWLRARVAHAEALASVSPSAGAVAGARLIPRLTEAGMQPELARVRALEA